MDGQLSPNCPSASLECTKGMKYYSCKLKKLVAAGVMFQDSRTMRRRNETMISRKHCCFFKLGWGQSWLFGKPAVSGFFDKKTAVSGFPAGFLDNNSRLKIALSHIFLTCHLYISYPVTIQIHYCNIVFGFSVLANFFFFNTFFSLFLKVNFDLVTHFASGMLLCILIPQQNHQISCCLDLACCSPSTMLLCILMPQQKP